MLPIYSKLFYLLWITILMRKKNECLGLAINYMIDWFRMTFDMCVGFLIWRKSYYLDVDIKQQKNVQFIVSLLFPCRLALYQVAKKCFMETCIREFILRRHSAENKYSISSNQNDVENCFYQKKLNSCEILLCCIFVALFQFNGVDWG